MMVDADLTSGREIEAAVERLLENPAIAYIHAKTRLLRRPDRSGVRRREGKGRSLL